jgi:hypothetical protein
MAQDRIKKRDDRVVGLIKFPWGGVGWGGVGGATGEMGFEAFEIPISQRERSPRISMTSLSSAVPTAVLVLIVAPMVACASLYPAAPSGRSSL